MSRGEEGIDFDAMFRSILGGSRTDAKAAVAKVQSGKEEVLADQPKAEKWFADAMVFVARNEGEKSEIYKSLEFALKVVKYLYTKFRATAVEWFPVLDTPRKALDDAERWLNVRGHLVNYRTAIEIDTINEDREIFGEPGWTGRAATAYKARIERQFGAANTLAYISRLTSNAILAYGNGLARILASFASELYAVGVKLLELIATVLTVNWTNLWAAVRAFIKQLGAMTVYFGNNAAAATINLDYTVYAMIKARQETTFLTKGDAMWPDPSRYIDFPLLNEDGKIVRTEPRRIGGPQPQ